MALKINNLFTSKVTKKANRSIKYLVIHYTAGTTSKDGKAKAVATQFRDSETKASADYVVDDKNIYCCNSDIKNQYTWAVGGDKYKNTKYGSLYGVCMNNNSIHIEMCSSKVNTKTLKAEDLDWYITDEVMALTVELTKELMKKYNISADNVIRHADVTGKYCPRPMMGTDKNTYHKKTGDALWTEFKNKIKSTSTTSTTSTKYTQANFVSDVKKVLGLADSVSKSTVLSKTITLSASTNKNHKLVTPLERYLKALGYYTGSIEADSGKTPCLGSGMTTAIKKYQKEVVKASTANQDGIVTAKMNTWKKLLGV